MKNENKKNFKIFFSSGFTLIELLAAVAIFGVTMAAVLGIFMNAIKQQQIIFAKQGVADNALYVMEFVIKELRMAQSIDPGSKNNNFTSMTFTNSSGETIIYSLSGSQFARKRGTDAARPISSSEIGICDLNFSINNWDAAHAPRITVFMKVVKGICASPQTALDMQATVSPRLY